MRKSKTSLLLNERNEFPVESWLSEIRAQYEKAQSTIKSACVLAELAGESRSTPIGLSCLHQGLMMAESIAELHLDSETLVAAILYPSVQYADLSLEDIKEQFNTSVTALIQGAKQMDVMHELYESTRQNQEFSGSSIDNLRKMLLAMVSDVRVVILKLVERLCVLKNCRILEEKNKIRIAKEVMGIYAPLANRLGIGQLKWELEDLAFRYLEPEKYKEISKSLKSQRTEREKYVQSVAKKLEKAIADTNITQFEVSGRVKHIYSIYRKMQRKHVNIEKIYDATAVRVLVPSITDCYTTLGHVHALWQHLPKEFDDYIAQPKSNGYRSIHTAVTGPENRVIEIQIRTFKMHEESELGVAAHWKYKENRRRQTDYEEKIAWLRQVMDWQKEISDNEQANNIHEHIFNDRIYVFTPHGDVIDLPKGATSLDFAYYIHSEIGHRCRGAKVNGMLVNLTHQLKTGDRVEILTTKQGKPSRDWLNPHLGYLQTARAKAKVHTWFRKQDYERNHDEGKELFFKEMKRLGIKRADQQKLTKQLNYQNFDDLLAGLGRGDIRIHTVINTIQNESPAQTTKELAEIPPQTEQHSIPISPTDIYIHGVGNLLTHIAQCCKPIPGDEIIGYITLGHGISIHRQDCANILRSQQSHHERLLQVSWGTTTRNKYPVDIIVDAYDRQGLVRDISQLLANERISILGLTCVTNKKDNTAHINFSIEIDSLNPLSRVLSRIQQLPNVLSAKRAS